MGFDGLRVAIDNRLARAVVILGPMHEAAARGGRGGGGGARGGFSSRGPARSGSLGQRGHGTRGGFDGRGPAASGSFEGSERRQGRKPAGRILTGSPSIEATSGWSTINRRARLHHGRW
jgi:hypothetical protein